MPSVPKHLELEAGNAEQLNSQMVIISRLCQKIVFAI